MHSQWDELRERLLRAGIAPRHVRRYLSELDDHLSDVVGQLRSEEQRNGRSTSQLGASARARLGTVDQLASAMESRPDLYSWSARAPWLIFTAGPACAILAAYALALTLLWTGWRLFLDPHSPTPFVPVHGFSVLWFGFGRLIYFTAPVVIAWLMAVLATRQRLSAVWPLMGFALLSLIGGTAQVHVGRWRTGAHVSMSLEFHDLAAFAREGQTLAFRVLSPGLQHILVLFTLAAAPYLLWRWGRLWAMA